MQARIVLHGPREGTNKQRFLSAEDFNNRTSFVTGQKDVTTAGTAEQLPDVEIPNGFAVVIKAKSTNTGRIYIGNSKANAEDHSVAFSLGANEWVELKITNLNLVWIDADVDGEGVEYIVET